VEPAPEPTACINPPLSTFRAVGFRAASWFATNIVPIVITIIFRIDLIPGIFTPYAFGFTIPLSVVLFTRAIVPRAMATRIRFDLLNIVFPPFPFAFVFAYAPGPVSFVTGPTLDAMMIATRAIPAFVKIPRIGSPFFGIEFVPYGPRKGQRTYDYFSR
jgi:hypothetical protein